ncbi:MAG: DUF6644 family protein [Gemmatimonadota bacterium]|nr:DUF6644 family protein [Gemmatimonadota bacterium]
MHDFLVWLGETPWSIALLESYWVWPLVESTHVLTLGVFVGTAIFNDFRLLGWSLKSVPVSQVTSRILPWTRASFAVMAVTGLLIFYSDPVRYYHNMFFRIKVVLLVIAGLNAFFFHRRIHRSVAEWDHMDPLPGAARRAGAISLAAWAFIVISGRLVAYNWFDCSIQPQPAWVNWISDCVLALP